MALDRAELFRKLLHIAFGAFAALLRWLTWPEAAAMALAALLFNWQVLPRVAPSVLPREGRHGRTADAGLLLYPAAVLGLVLAFHDRLWMAAAVWGVLACGDGMASLVGQWTDGPRLPWNRSKTWSGLFAFVAFGTPAAALLTAWTAGLPWVASASPWVAGGSVLLAATCGVAESLPTGIDDNVTVPVAGALVMVALAEARAGVAPFG